MSAVGSRYRATATENLTVDSGVYALIVNCEVLSRAVSNTILNPITDPNSVYRHPYTWQYVLFLSFQVLRSEVRISKEKKVETFLPNVLRNYGKDTLVKLTNCTMVQIIEMDEKTINDK
jgi:hypothetical protein